MKMQPNELGVKRVLENFFNFLSAEAEEFIANTTGELRQNYVKMYEKDGSEYLKNFLIGQLYWNYDDMLWAYKIYINLLELDENKFYWKILDIGSAWGDFLYMAKRKNTFQNSELVGIDINKNFIKKWCDAGLDIRYMDARELDFPDESFDLMISIGATPHTLYENDEQFIEVLKKYIENIFRILKKWWEFRVYTLNANFHKDNRGKIIQKIFDEYGKNFSFYERKITFIDEKDENDERRYLYIFRK